MALDDRHGPGLALWAVKYIGSRLSIGIGWALVFVLAVWVAIRLLQSFGVLQ